MQLQATKTKNYKRRTQKEDLELLEYLQSHEIKDAAIKFHMTEAAIRQWLHRLRFRINKLQGYLNRIRALQKNSSRIRKLTSVGLVPEQTDDDRF